MANHEGHIPRNLTEQEWRAGREAALAKHSAEAKHFVRTEGGDYVPQEEYEPITERDQLN